MGTNYHPCEYFFETETYLTLEQYFPEPCNGKSALRKERESCSRCIWQFLPTFLLPAPPSEREAIDHGKWHAATEAAADAAGTSGEFLISKSSTSIHSPLSLSVRFRGHTEKLSEFDGRTQHLTFSSRNLCRGINSGCSAALRPSFSSIYIGSSTYFSHLRSLRKRRWFHHEIWRADGRGRSPFLLLIGKDGERERAT